MKVKAPTIRQWLSDNKGRLVFVVWRDAQSKSSTQDSKEDIPHPKTAGFVGDVDKDGFLHIHHEVCDYDNTTEGSMIPVNCIKTIFDNIRLYKTKSNRVHIVEEVNDKGVYNPRHRA